MEIMNSHVILICENMQIHCPHIVFLTFCRLHARTEKVSTTTTTSKHDTNSILKSVNNQCENDAPKSDAKIMENGAKMESERRFFFDFHIFDELST